MAEQRISLIDSAVALSATTAFLYCVSTAYYGGYFRIFQLDADILDRNFHQSLYNGFVVSYSPALLGLFVYAIARFFYSHTILPSFSDFLRHSRARKRQFLKFKYLWMGKRKDSELEQHQKKHTRTVASYLIVFIFIILALAYFESKGKKAANVILDKIEQKDFKHLHLIAVKINDKIHQVVDLTCGSRNCAGIEPDTKIIYYFGQNGHSYQLSVPETTQQVIPGT
jgi:hypothetical protein